VGAQSEVGFLLFFNRYTMLLGRPPFETTNLKETYRCIREARYSLPSSLLAPAKHLIASMLSKNPEDRPSLDEIIRHDFFVQVCLISCSGLKPYLPLQMHPVVWKLLFQSHFHRALHLTDFLLAVVTLFLTFICQVLLKISSKKQLLLFLVVKRIKPDTSIITVSEL